MYIYIYIEESIVVAIPPISAKLLVQASLKRRVESEPVAVYLRRSGGVEGGRGEGREETWNETLGPSVYSVTRTEPAASVRDRSGGRNTEKSSSSSSIREF